MNPLKEYHFTDEQIDMILNLVRHEASILKRHCDDEYKSCNELAKQIEDQIVNPPSNK